MSQVIRTSSASAITVQLIAKNYSFTAKPSCRFSHAVRDGFSDSLIASTTVASQPHPERKTGADRCQSRCLHRRHRGW
jgi:hypothetical protein